ncbi:unnamed protein product [Orchesella dallaii]|uniref:F-box domain-containing protein n=1 Tax=Orchesella dallaii TaxID=48710 RepID=A0ABP1RBK7_9HEXA
MDCERGSTSVSVTRNDLYHDSQMDLEHHPLLNDLVLSTLASFIDKSDLTNFRRVCGKWKDAVEWKFRQECWVNLCNQDRLYKFLKDFQIDLLQAANPRCPSSIPFDAFSLAEIQFAKGPITSPSKYTRPHPNDLNHHLFFNQLLPSVKQLQLKPEYISIGQFRKVLRAVGESIRVLEMQLDENITTRTRIFRMDNEMVQLRNLRKIRWMTDLDIMQNAEEFNGWSTDGSFNVGFLKELYSTAWSLQYLECPVDPSSHLQAIHQLIDQSLNPFHSLHTLKLGVLNQSGFETLVSLGKQGLSLRELSVEGIGGQVQSRTLTEVLFQQKDTLSILDLGKVVDKNREHVLYIELPILQKLKHLKLYFSSKMRFQSADLFKKIPKLRQLHLAGDTMEKNCLKGFYQIQNPIPSLRKLEILLQFEVHYENLAGFAEIFPNVTALTLGKPSKNALKILWTLWSELRELKIITACHHIDEVLSGIPIETCQKMLAGRDYDQDILEWYCDEPSIRELKKLQRLEINVQLSSKFHSLSCLPSDVSAYMAFMHLPELRYLVIHRSLISNEASAKLDESMANWTSKIDPIQLKYDETIDAFQFHRNHQKFMKLLCRYPHQSLHMLPDFMTSLWMNNQLDL